MTRLSLGRVALRCIQCKHEILMGKMFFFEYILIWKVNFYNYHVEKPAYVVFLMLFAASQNGMLSRVVIWAPAA